jgi:hypothetical protein
MTGDERATIYGRAMLDLKECNANIAALLAYFSDYAARLHSAGDAAKNFAIDPEGVSPNRGVLAEHVKQENLRLTRADFGEKVDELVSLVCRARELKAQVDRF